MERKLSNIQVVLRLENSSRIFKQNAKMIKDLMFLFKWIVLPCLLWKLAFVVNETLGLLFTPIAIYMIIKNGRE